MPEKPDIKWIVNTSAEEGVAAIKRLLEKPITAETLRTLRAAEEYENCLPSGQRRVTLHEALIRAVTKVNKVLAAEKSAEVMTRGTPAYGLTDTLTALENQRQILISKEEEFLDGTLVNRLKIGLHCLKAHVLFAHNPGKGGKPSRRDGLTIATFETWLADSATWLKKPTAYKYMTALKGLSLDEKATEEQVEFALDNLRASQASANLPNPTLASLVAAAVEAVAPPKLPPPPPEQGEFEFLRESLVHLREQDEHLAEIEGQLRKNPEMLKVASARIYSMLHRLTGTHWAPSDDPDDLANVDPDALTL